VAASEAAYMTEYHTQKILQAEKEIRALLGNPEGPIAIIFRIGYGKPPSARSKKSIPTVAWET
jgi:hypothetical protein